MKKRYWVTAGWGLLVAGMVLALGHTLVLSADFEVTGPDGRRIQLKDDGTWRYLDAKGKDANKDTKEAKGKDLAKDTKEAKDAKDATDKPKVVGEGVLFLDRKRETGNICRYDVRLVNNTNHEIRSLGPSFAAYRLDGVVYDTVLVLFQGLKPGDSQTREVVFRGIPCPNISRVQVGGGDRCVMGEYDRWDIEPGRCLARVRVVKSDIVRFDKDK